MSEFAFDHPAFDMGRVIKRTVTLIGRHALLAKRSSTLSYLPGPDRFRCTRRS